MPRRMARTKLQRTNKGGQRCLCAQHASTTDVVRVMSIPRARASSRNNTFSKRNYMASLDNFPRFSAVTADVTAAPVQDSNRSSAGGGLRVASLEHLSLVRRWERRQPAVLIHRAANTGDSALAPAQMIRRPNDELVQLLISAAWCVAGRSPGTMEGYLHVVAVFRGEMNRCCYGGNTCTTAARTRHER